MKATMRLYCYVTGRIPVFKASRRALMCVSSLGLIAGAAPPAGGGYKVLHRFGSGTDGAYPYTDLIAVHGTLYGDTYDGGADNDGTLFALDPTTGKEQVLYAFKGNSDGADPIAGLIDVKGTLYGTSLNGGTGTNNCDYDRVAGCGTVYALTLKTGAERVVYSFQGGADGGYPEASLINVGGTLYGTTAGGGSTNCGGGCGTVFSVDIRTGAKTTVYSFQGGTSDGFSPVSALTSFNGLLYGTTAMGGATDGGTLFAIQPSDGTERILHSFSVAATPSSPLTLAGNVFYGTTNSGGAYEVGAIFAFDPGNGAFSNLLSFQNSSTGAYPEGGLTASNGLLYGTTSVGGDPNDCDIGLVPGCGTVFSFNPKTGVEKILYSFQGFTDGANPVNSLARSGQYLFGTTVYGGKKGENCFEINCGTAFRVSR